MGSTGCMVLDEVDAANAKMSGASKKSKDSEASSSVANAPPTKNELLEQSKEWWSRATSLAPEADSSIVSCRFREGTQFMAKDDCLTQGGVAAGISG
jgi:hypothetical protein